MWEWGGGGARFLCGTDGRGGGGGEGEVGLRGGGGWGFVFTAGTIAIPAATATAAESLPHACVRSAKRTATSAALLRQPLAGAKHSVYNPHLVSSPPPPPQTPHDPPGVFLTAVSYCLLAAFTAVTETTNDETQDSS